MAIASGVVVAPGTPRNSPPAISTSSATHCCGVDDRLTPLFAMDERARWDVSCLHPHRFDGCLHFGNDSFAFGRGVGNGGDESDVSIDIGQSVRRKREHGVSCFENGGKRFLPIGYGCDDQD